VYVILQPPGKFDRGHPEIYIKALNRVVTRKWFTEEKLKDSFILTGAGWRAAIHLARNDFKQFYE